MSSPTIEEITTRHYAWLERMGWTTGTIPLEELALIGSEIGEAAECVDDSDMRSRLLELVEVLARAVNQARGHTSTDKLGAELADIILRTVGLARRLGVDLSTEIENKMAANERRGSLGRVK
jgi:hypothetical protein